VITGSPPANSSIVEVLQGLFSDPETRPKTLYRDLQFIAAFIPSETLEKSAHGKAFADTCVAAIGLKEDVVRYMVEIADNIVQEYTDMRPIGSTPVVQLQPTNEGATDITTDATASAESGASTGIQEPLTDQRRQSPSKPRYTMADAAHMYQIAAREGNAAAERELAIFYLTQPDITPRVMQPFAKPKDVFKNLEKVVVQRRGEDGKGDPATLCLAHHWMEMGKIGGDELAVNYLKDRDDFEKIPGA